jgi:hypothetical protein
MLTSLLAALNSLPKILAALERLGDIATAQMAQQRKGVKDEKVESIIAAAAARREQRLLEREAERLRGDSKPE